MSLMHVLDLGWPLNQQTDTMQRKHVRWGGVATPGERGRELMGELTPELRAGRRCGRKRSRNSL